MSHNFPLSHWLTVWSSEVGSRSTSSGRVGVISIFAMLTRSKKLPKTRKCLFSTFNGHKSKVPAVTRTPQLKFTQKSAVPRKQRGQRAHIVAPDSLRDTVSPRGPTVSPCRGPTGALPSGFGGAERRCRECDPGGNAGRNDDVTAAADPHTAVGLKWCKLQFAWESLYPLRGCPTIFWQLFHWDFFVIRKYLRNQNMAPDTVAFHLSLREGFSLNSWPFHLFSC